MRKVSTILRNVFMAILLLLCAALFYLLVIMGGLLNEALPGKNLPEDVSGLVAELGFNVDNNAEDIVNVIAKHAGKEA